MDWTALQQHPAWEWLAAHQDWLGLLIVAIAFIESFAVLGVIVPGVVLMYIAAFLAGSGGLPLGYALAGAWLGAVLGDGLSFLIGRYFHRHLPNTWPFSQHTEWLAKAEGLIESYGAAAVIGGRFIGPIRPMMPLIAGSLMMQIRVFYPINLASAVVWAPVYILPGFFAGAAIEAGADWHRYLAGAVIVLAILAIAAIALRKHLRI